MLKCVKIKFSMKFQEGRVLSGLNEERKEGFEGGTT